MSTLQDTASLARSSRVVATWVLMSRVTGFLRVAMSAAVLGPTFFGNLFQLLSTLPSLVFGMLAGSLCSAMLVPPMVRYLDDGDTAAAERLASGVLGLGMFGCLVVAALGVLLGPLLLAVMAAAVADPAAQQEQIRLGWPMLAALLPLLACYAVSAVSVAAQQARGRFALAAAAPAIENVGVTLVLVMFALLRSGPSAEASPSDADALLLGLGVTAAAALSSASQWWGARRAGLRLLPSAGWRQPEVRRLVRVGLSSLGYTGLSGAAYIGMLVIAAGVPGGVVAYQIANSFVQLPVALTAGAVSAVHLPQLSRHARAAMPDEFARDYREALSLVLFVVLPASLLMLVLAGPLAEATAFGRMTAPTAIMLLATAIALRAPGVLAEAVVTLGTAASYARGDTASPLRAMAAFFTVSVAGMLAAMATTEPVMRIAALAGTATLAGFGAAAYLHFRLPDVTLDWREACANLAISIIAVGPAWLIAQCVPGILAGTIGRLEPAIAASAAACFCYVALQVARGSGNLVLLLPVFVSGQRRSAPRAAQHAHRDGTS